MDLSEVIEFDKNTLEWEIIGNMTNEYNFIGHAASLVLLDDIKQYCPS